MEKKVRIQLFTAEGVLYSDRLVEQDPEMAKGPKEVGSPMMKVEFSFLENGDIEKAIKYIQQLAGVIPVEASTKKIKKSEVPDIDNREQFLTTILETPKGNQDDLIKFLRENDFVFVMTDHLESMGLPIKLKTLHKEKYQWMIRLVKRAKNPKSDKYDPMLVFGISLMGERDEKLVVYLNGEYKTKFVSQIPDKPRETFKKSGMIKFPQYMTLEERERFRIELRPLLDDPTKEFSKFFKRWMQYVENLPDLTRKEKE